MHSLVLISQLSLGTTRQLPREGIRQRCWRDMTILSVLYRQENGSPNAHAGT